MNEASVLHFERPCNLEKFITKFLVKITILWSVFLTRAFFHPLLRYIEAGSWYYHKVKDKGSGNLWYVSTNYMVGRKYLTPPVWTSKQKTRDFIACWNAFNCQSLKIKATKNGVLISWKPILNYEHIQKWLFLAWQKSGNTNLFRHLTMKTWILKLPTFLPSVSLGTFCVRIGREHVLFKSSYISSLYGNFILEIQ